METRIGLMNWIFTTLVVISTYYLTRCQLYFKLMFFSAMIFSALMLPKVLAFTYVSLINLPQNTFDF